MSADDSDTERSCPKCDHEEATVGEVGMTTDEVSLVADTVNDLRYQRIECTNCGYAEFYNKHTGDLDTQQLADFFFESD